MNVRVGFFASHRCPRSLLRFPVVRIAFVDRFADVSRVLVARHRVLQKSHSFFDVVAVGPALSRTRDFQTNGKQQDRMLLQLVTMHYVLDTNTSLLTF